MKTIYAFFLILFFVPTVFAAGALSSLSDASYLRKLSLHLRGQAPSADEYAALKAQPSPEGRSAFLRAKVDEYLKSPEHQDRMVFRLTELFGVRTPEIDLNVLKQLDETELAYVYFRNGIPQDALLDLFASLGRDNLSWDTLLTGKSYTLYPNYSQGSSIYASDYKFYQFVTAGIPEQPSRPQQNGEDRKPTKGFPISFATDDARIAGALTTPRFINRYNTTNVNKNRRRAAAVFRIFLCDPMFPIIPPPLDKKAAAIDQAYEDGNHAHVTEQQLSDSLTLTDSMRHGADPKCAACHYKLDPMGRTFQNIGMTLGPEAARGILTFKHENGELVKTPLAGIGDLGREITKQPEYVSCQIDWFWKQFIGTNATLSPERKKELTKTFDSLGRRTNDFIRVLVTSPEFRTAPLNSSKISFAQVAPLLKRCDTCHSTMENMPTFASGDIPKAIAIKMRMRVNLPEGNPMKMPRDWMKWDAKDLATVKAWLEQGAVNAKGEVILSDDHSLRGAK